MTLANLRASAWKYASIVCAVLAVAAILGCLFLRGAAVNAGLRADAAEQRAQEAEGRVRALRESIGRDDVAAEATTAARSAADARQPEREARQKRVEAIAHEPRDPVPADCPGGDARILSDSAAATARISSAEDRLRGLRGAEGGKAGAAATD